MRACVGGKRIYVAARTRSQQDSQCFQAANGYPTDQVRYSTSTHLATKSRTREQKERQTQTANICGAGSFTSNYLTSVPGPPHPSPRRPCECPSTAPTHVSSLCLDLFPSPAPASPPPQPRQPPLTAEEWGRRFQRAGAAPAAAAAPTPQARHDRRRPRTTHAGRRHPTGAAHAPTALRCGLCLPATAAKEGKTPPPCWGQSAVDRTCFKAFGCRLGAGLCLQRGVPGRGTCTEGGG